MSKKKCIAVTLSVLSVLVVAASLGRGALGSSSTESRRQSAVATGPAPTGTLQKMIVENGTVSMDLDLSALNGDSSLVARPITLQFAVGANSFFPILIFNDLLRGLEPGSMALVPAGANAPGYSLPASLSASFKQLRLSKNFLQARRSISLCVIATPGSRFSTSKGTVTTTTPRRSRLQSPMAGSSFQKNLPTRSAESRTPVQLLEQSPSARDATDRDRPAWLMAKPHRWSCRLCNMRLVQTRPGPVHGPDVIVGQVEDVAQMGHVETQFNFAVGTDSCNNGDVGVDWFALPNNTDHPSFRRIFIG